jgi:WS/DGAT/MGAT family acyltransferase
LSAFDAQFLAGEAGNMVSHYVGLWIAAPDRDGHPLTAERVRAIVAARLDRIPALRWRLQTVPFGLEHPRFVDGAVDLDQHVIAGTVAAPGGDRELAAATAAVMATRLDRRRPLWEFHVLDGLADGRVAVAMKFHHAAADALSAATLMGLLLDADPDGRDDLPAPVAPGASPEARTRLVRTAGGIAWQPVRSVRAGLNALPHLDQVPMLRTVPGARLASGLARRVQRAAGRGQEEPEAFLAAPRMRFNGPLSPGRSIAFGTVDVADVRRLKDHHGATFNDVVVAAVAGGLRRRLSATDELPDTPLLAFVPTNVRSPTHDGRIENAISSFVVPIPTHLDGAAPRVKASRDAMVLAKARHANAPSTLLEDANAMIFPIVFAPLASGILRLMGSGLVSPPLNLTLSNVPGPPMRLHLDGAPLERVAPLSLVFDGVALNVTVVSYAGRLEIGIVGDAEHVPDAWEIVEEIQAEFASMLEEI